MNLMITVSDAFKSDTGQTVLAGVNPKFNSISVEQIKKICIGKKLIKHKDGYSKIIEIDDVQCTESIWGKKNIFLLSSTILPIKEIPINAIVYSNTDSQ